MKNTLKETEQYLSSKDAGKLLGYTHDYISKLCREGKMKGMQKGRVWYVTEKEILLFKKRHNKELSQKKALLSQKFSELRQQHESKRLEEPTLETAIEEKTHIPTKIPFVIPKQFVAIAVLAVLLLIPTLVNSVPKATTSSQTLSLNTVSYGGVVKYFDEGVTTVLKTQSELVSQTANTYSFVQNLNDGYWQLAMSTIELSKGFYSFLEIISDGYLTFYVMQGQMVYESIIQTGNQMQNMGTVVLSGYELLGQSLVIGGSNVVHSYQSALNLNSNLETSKKKLDNFSQNTSEGLAYTQSQIKNTLISSIIGEVQDSTRTVVNNINSNIFYVSQTLKSTSNIVTASIISIFSFDFLKQKEEVRKVQ